MFVLQHGEDNGKEKYFKTLTYLYGCIRLSFHVKTWYLVGAKFLRKF